MPFSPGYSFDDELLNDLSIFDGLDVVVTEKMDGENTSLYKTHWHARGLDSRRKHESRDWLANFWASKAHKIPQHWRFCGENLYAKHSIQYTNLQDYFYGFSVWNADNIALSWKDTLKVFQDAKIVSVPVIYEGKFSFETLTSISSRINTQFNEGFVLRYSGEIPYKDFGIYVAKWVRPYHVQPDSKHWFASKVIKNSLASG